VTDPVEPPDLDAIRKRCDTATPGPWHAVEANRMSSRVQWDVEEAADLEALAGCWWGDAEANAKFIAHAREDVPALAAALVAASGRAETAEAERDRLREALHEVGERTDYIAGEMDDCERGDLERDLRVIDAIVNRALTADLGSTSGGFHTEEPNP